MTASDSPMSVRKYAKLAALGAVGVSLGVFALYALIAVGSRHTASGGIRSNRGGGYLDQRRGTVCGHHCRTPRLRESPPRRVEETGLTDRIPSTPECGLLTGGARDAKDFAQC